MDFWTGGDLAGWDAWVVWDLLGIRRILGGCADKGAIRGDGWRRKSGCFEKEWKEDGKGWRKIVYLQKKIEMKTKLFCLALLSVGLMVGCHKGNGNTTESQSDTTPAPVETTIDLNNMAFDTLHGFKGGEGDMLMKMYSDGGNRIMQATIPTGSSVGEHAHETDMEIILVQQGHATIVMDNVETVYGPGMVHYCPKGHRHSISNKGDDTLMTFNVVATQE